MEHLGAPPTGPIPLGGPLPPQAGIPREKDHLLISTSTWEEMEAALRQFRERDHQCQRARANLIAAFQTWMEGHSESPKAAKNWWRLVEHKLEELRTPPTGSLPEQRPAGREPWRRRPQGNGRR